MIPWNIFHSNSVGSVDSIHILEVIVEYHLILLFRVATGSSPIPHRALSRRRRRFWRW